MTKALKSKDLKQMKTQLKRFKQFDLDPEDKMVAYVQKVVKELTVKESKYLVFVSGYTIQNKHTMDNLQIMKRKVNTFHEHHKYSEANM